MEWSATGEDGHILTTVNEAIHNWHVNIIRLPWPKIDGSVFHRNRRIKGLRTKRLFEKWWTRSTRKAVTSC